MELLHKSLIIAATALAAVIYCPCLSNHQPITTLPEWPAKEPIRRALLIGINEYQLSLTATSIPGSPVLRRGESRSYWENLNAPINDVDQLHEILIARYGFKPEHIHVLKNKDATREKILAEYRKHLIDESASGDVGLFFFAGHGSQVFNSKSTEADKLDESLVPSDSSDGAWDIRDKELARLFNKSLDKGVLLTVIVDSCHSGSIARGGYPREEKVRWLQPDLRDVRDPPDLGKRPEQRGALVFSASLEDQPAAERKDADGVPHGIFSDALCKTLRSAPVNEPAERVYLRVKALMQAEGFPQEPLLEGTVERRRKSLFGAEYDEHAVLRTIAALKITERGELELQGGKAVGLVEGCELKRIGKSVETPLRIRVTRVDGLNRSQAVVIEGNPKEIQTGNLFEVDHWIAPREATLRVWMPPATLPYPEIFRTAQELSTLSTSVQVEWVDDPTEPASNTAPLYVITWEGSEWALALLGSRLKLGKSPTTQTVLNKLPASGSVKPRLFVHIPPPLELAKELRLGEGTTNDSINLVSSPEQANYMLVGRIQGKEIQYAWMLPNITKEQGRNLPLPARTDWLVINETANMAVTTTARNLEDLILRIGRVKAWLQIEAPPDSKPFPYRLALKNAKTRKIKTTEKTFEGETYVMMLTADREQLAKEVVLPRYVYVFKIDHFGKSRLLFQGEQRIPFEIAGRERSKFPTEFPLGDDLFEVRKPFGIDTFILLTSEDVIPNAADIFTSDGVQTGEPDERSGQDRSPLARLLYKIGSATRGDNVVNPAGWSIQRLFVKSEPVPGRSALKRLTPGRRRSK